MMHYDDLVTAISVAREEVEEDGVVFVCRNPAGWVGDDLGSVDILLRTTPDDNEELACKGEPEHCPLCLRIYPDDRRTSEELAEAALRMN